MEYNRRQEDEAYIPSTLRNSFLNRVQNLAEFRFILHRLCLQYSHLYKVKQGLPLLTTYEESHPSTYVAEID